MNFTDLEPTLLPHTASVSPTVNREPGTLNHAKIQPGSQDFAGASEIELAYHQILQTSAKLNWSQHVELLPVLGEISLACPVIFEESEKKVVFVIDNSLHMWYDQPGSCDLHPSIRHL